MHTCPVGQWMHVAVQLAPVVFVSGAHVVPHRWKPALHVSTQDVPLQVAVPFVSVGQTVHVAPQAAMVSLATHVGAAAVPPGQ